MLVSAAIGWLNDIPLLGAPSWSAMAGLEPASTTVYMPWDWANRAAKIPRHAASLTLGRGDGTLETWAGLSIRRIRPGPDPYIAAVQLVDRRHWWFYPSVYRPMNIRTRTGFTRRSAWDGQANADLAQLDPLEPTYAYKRYSLFEESTPWTAARAFAYILGVIDPKAVLRILDPLLAELLIQELVLDGVGTEALSQLLRQLPGTGVGVNRLGEVELFSIVDGSETIVLNALGPMYQGSGDIAMSDRSFERPEYIEVSFEYEIERRFDFLGDTAAHPDDPAGVSGLDIVTEAPTAEASYVTPARLRNVSQWPDFLPATGIDGRTITQHDIVGFPEMLYLFQQAAGDNLLRYVNFAFLREAAAIPGRGLFGAMGMLGESASDADSSDWVGRALALQTDYRSLFQIPQDWLDRVASVQPTLISTANPITGRRAPARVWADYTVVTSDKGRLVAGSGTQFANVVYGYPRDPNPPYGPLALGELRAVDVGGATQGPRPAPAKVTVPDSDLGLIQLHYVADPFKLAESVLPSAVDNGPVYEKGSGNRTRTVYFNSIAAGTEPCRLAETHYVAVVLTLVPGIRRFVLRVYPNMVEGSGLLPRSVGRCTGPPMRIHCPAETARVMWREEYRAAIDAVFFGSSDRARVFTGQADDEYQIASQLTPAVLNLDSVIRPATSSTAAVAAVSLWDLALAEAASAYAKLLDVPEGSARFALQMPSLRGSILSMIHGVDASGVPGTTVTMRDELPEIDLRAFLDDRSRRLLAKAVYQA